MVANNFSYDGNGMLVFSFSFESLIMSYRHNVGLELLKFKPQPILQIASLVSICDVIISPPIFVVPYAYKSFGHFKPTSKFYEIKKKYDKINVC